MKSLILHIGIAKTGTSALQVFLAQNRDELLGHSLDYFNIGDFALGARGKISSGNAGHLARSLLPTQAAAHLQGRDKFLEALEAEIAASPCETGLLSSEVFATVPDESLKHLRDWLAARGIALRVYFFFRNQIAFLTSTYIQQVKRHGSTEMPEDYILRCYQNIPSLKYFTLFTRLNAIVGRANVLCDDYDAASAAPDGLYQALLKTLSLPLQGYKLPEGQVNPSLDLGEIAIMLMLNRLKPRMFFSDYLVENAARRGRSSTDLVRKLLTPRTIRTLETYFAEENAKFAQACLGRAQLYERLAADGGEVAFLGAELSFADVVNTLGGLLVRFDERIAELERRVQGPPK
jgi:hypothetical protein